MSKAIQGFKIFTHDFRSPLQGGNPIWDGTVPFDLPSVTLDTSDAECAAGWNFVEDIATGFKIAGMWPTGRPAVVAVVEASRDAIKRGNKMRCSSLRITKLATEVQIAKAIEDFSRVFGKHAEEMANEQIAWRYALGRPEHNKTSVMENLKKALAHRGLKWKVKEYKTARAARDVWDVWDVRAVRAARDVWDVRAVRAARDSWDVWAARDAWAARDVWDVRAARAAWDARDARDALVLFFASKQGWVKRPADLLTHGIRDAYTNGLEIALPAAKDTLGFAMEAK